ncbi:putative aromatic-L-amino-acid decarboxylase [Naematelia encephala]|uniref:Putative aromatic-L-amino-acid decarboxylase n=1 Tax=Naematelia encephala TaxID=71784 RepID=A0A1Y2AYY6_9TREE|nr:putative aromatic-L-amino-acid decarboxylase [Naematelia encephala]
MDIEQFRQAGYATVDAICDYYASIDSRPVKAEVQPGFLIESLPPSAPARGESMQHILADFQSLILPGITHWQHGKFFAYFPANSTFESMLGDLLATSVSNPGFNWVCSPACTELEQCVVDWTARMLGLDDVFLTSSKRGGGIIMNSASESALTAAMAARERSLRWLSQEGGSSEAGSVPGSDIPLDCRQQSSQKLVMYGSTQTHSLGAKAAKLLGLQFRAVAVSAADDYALRGAPLRDAIETDVAQGMIPFFVIATIGTTSSGAVDHIAEIGEVLRAYPTAFLHVDAAWAGVALALPDQRKNLRLDQVNQYANSFCTNAHKWGLTAFDCSLCYIRDRRDFTDAFDVTPHFLRSKEGDSGTVIDYRNWQIALGRRFRSLKLWFVLRSYGTDGFKKHLSNGIELCGRLEGLVRESSNFEIVTPRSLALLVIRLKPQSEVPVFDEELNLLNQRLSGVLNARSDVFLTETMLHSTESDIRCLRIALGGARTTWRDVEEVWEVIETEGNRIVETWREDGV